MKKVICYIDKNQPITQPMQWVDNIENIDDFIQANPNIEIKYAFDMTTDLDIYHTREQREFNLYCDQYGFVKTDYNRPFIIRTYTANKYEYHELNLIGFLPKNHKYKCRARDMTTGKVYKITIMAVNNGMENYDIYKQYM